MSDLRDAETLRPLLAKLEAELAECKIVAEENARIANERAGVIVDLNVKFLNAVNKVEAVVEAAKAVHDAKDGFKRAEVWPRLTAALKALGARA